MTDLVISECPKEEQDSNGMRGNEEGDGGIFIFAGISAEWASPDGELETCAIIATEANSLMQPIHNRMPVILDPQAAGAWLDSENRHPEDLLVPSPAEAMAVWPVGVAVGNIRNDGPELIHRV